MRGGLWLSEERGDNLVVQAGKNMIAEIIRTNNGSGAKPTHLGVADNGGAVSEAQTALLGTEVLARVAMVVTRLNNELTFTGTVTNPGPGIVTVTEYGIFSAAVAGTMYNRWLTQTRDMSPADQLMVAWSLLFG